MAASQFRAADFSPALKVKVRISHGTDAFRMPMVREDLVPAVAVLEAVGIGISNTRECLLRRADVTIGPFFHHTTEQGGKPYASMAGMAGVRDTEVADRSDSLFVALF
jgi:hypothetical protein